MARHTYAMLAVSYGMDVYTISKSLGHTNVNTTSIYAKLMDEKKQEEIERLPVLYIHTKQNTGWFDRLFGHETVKKLFNGIKFSDCPVPFKFETKLTYKGAMYGNASDIVICCGIDADDILKIDDYHSVK